MPFLATSLGRVTKRVGARRIVLFVVAVAAMLIVPVAVNALTSPRTWVDSPAERSTVTGDLVVTGSARHNKGVATVELVVKNRDDTTYWNGKTWQQGFTRVSVAVDDPGAKRSNWSFTLSEDEMTRGNYRARAFARSVEGNGDAYGGDLNDFFYIPGLDPGLYDTEILTPEVGAELSGEIRVAGDASSMVGVAEVQVAIQNRTTKQYWDSETQTWSTGYVRSIATLNNTGGTKVSWHVDVPADQATVGRYSSRAWVRTSTDLGDPFGRGRTSFSVVEDGRPTSTTTTTTTTPTTPPTTAPPTTGPSSTEPSSTTVTTSAPTTTVVQTTSSTTKPTDTTVPPTSNPSTTSPPTTTAPTTSPSTSVPPTSCREGDASILLPCRGVLIGASGDFKADDGSARSKQDHFSAMEDRLNAKFDIFHDFLQWNDLVNKTWPSQKTQALADDGHILLTNWKSPTGRVTDWALIASGRYDNDIIAAANQVRDFNEPTFITFYHEPEDNIRDAANGDAAKTQRYIDDYRDAFRHIVSVFEENGADNAVWVWDMQGWLGGFEDYYLNGLYPGDDVVDWVAWNPYNWHGCENHGNTPKWKTFEEVIAPFYDWLEEGGPDRPGKDKPLMLGEWGSEENDGATNSSQTKAEWLDDARQILPTRFPRLKAVVYFDTEGRRADGTVQFCEWAIDSSRSSLTAMTNLLTDPTLTAQWQW